VSETKGDEAVAGVGDEGHSGVADERDFCALLQSEDEFGGAGHFIVFVVLTSGL